MSEVGIQAAGEEKPTMQTAGFVNSRGQRVKGILYGDLDRGAQVGVIYLPGIVLGSVAVHRLGVEVALALAGAGHPVFLFDHAGIGESEGEHPSGTHQALSVWVESGQLVDDTLAAIDFFRRRAQLKKVVLVGHCGGALTAMYTTPLAGAVAGAFLINPPVQRLGAGHELDQRGRADQYFTLYLQKVFSVEAWTRLLRGKSSYATLWRVLKTKLRPPASAPSNGKADGEAKGKAAADRFNPRLLASLVKAAGAGKRVAVVYGDREPDLADFEQWRGGLPPNVSARVYPKASHGYLTDESLKLLFGDIGEFVRSLERDPRRAQGRSPRP
jgi:pimeloyl-ACP methyl ester carboxylesterase